MVEIVEPEGGPGLSLLEPAAGARLVSETSVLGLAGTPGPEAVEVRWRTPTQAGSATGTATWTASALLDVGLQELTVEALDASGGASAVRLEVLYQPDTRFSDRPTVSDRVVRPGETVAVSARFSTTGAQVQDGVARLACRSGETAESPLGVSQEGEGWSASAAVVVPAAADTCRVTVHPRVDGAERTSLPALVWVREPLEKARYDELLSLEEATAAALQAESEDEVGLDAALAVLVAHPEVVERTGRDTGLLWWVTREGLQFSLSETAPGTSGGGAARPLPAPAPPPPTDDEPIDLGGDEAWVFEPFSWQTQTYWTTSTCHQDLGDREGPGDIDGRTDTCGEPLFSTVHHITDDQATPAALSSITPGLVYIATHGSATGSCSAADLPWQPEGTPCGSGADVSLATGAVWVDLDNASFAELQSQIEELGVTGQVSWSRTYRWEPSPDTGSTERVRVVDTARILVNSSFFRESLDAGALQDSVVLASACQSAMNNALAGALMDRGAVAVLGYTDSFVVCYGDDVERPLLERWLGEGDTLWEAWEATSAELGGRTDEDLYGEDGSGALPYLWMSEDVRSPASGGDIAVDGDFEDGSGWVRAGKVEFPAAYAQHGASIQAHDHQMLQLGWPENTDQVYGNVRIQLPPMEAGEWTIAFDAAVATDYHNAGGSGSCETASPGFAVGIGRYAPAWELPWYEDLRPATLYCGQGAFTSSYHWETDWIHREVQLSLPEDVEEPWLFLNVYGGYLQWFHQVFVDDLSVTPACE